LVLIHQYTRHNVPDDCNLHQKKSSQSVIVTDVHLVQVTPITVLLSRF